jgi:tetratricopeptide (TPR) repeat protein
MLVVSASDDGTARLWDAASGRPVSEPFVHRDKVVSAHFSPDGRHVLTASRDQSASVWDVPPVFPNTQRARRPGEKTDQSPALFLADLTDAVIGKRVDSQGALESVSTTLDEVQQRLSRLPRDADFTRWLEWFFADRSLRTISPYSQVRMPDYVWSQANDTNYASWRNALQLCPTNGDAFAHMARYYLRASQTPDSPEAARAEWSSRQAVKFTPWHWLSWYCQRKVLRHTGAWSNLLPQAEAMLQAQPDNHYAWNAKGLALAMNEHWDAAVVAFTRALEIGDRERRFVTEPRIREEILLNRAAAWRGLGRMAEASQDNLAGCQLTARDPEAEASLIDLSAFYNGGAAEEFPNSVRRLAGTDFDFRGWIQLDVHRVRPESNLPERVNGIPIGRHCRRLHFLHAAGYTQYRSTGTNGVREEYLNVPFGVAVGHYLVHYADGQQVDIPILHGPDVRDYWQIQESVPDGPDLVVAWSGSSAYTRKNGATIRLYKSTWVNPRPLVLIRTVDFLHADTHAAPILVAITAE